MRTRNMTIENETAKAHYKSIALFTILAAALIQVCAWALHPKIDPAASFIFQKEMPSAQPAMNTPKTETVEEFLASRNIRSIDDFAVWLEQNVEYKKDGVDEWSTPMETIARGFGDCEDIAFLTTAVIKSFGYEAQVLAVDHVPEPHVFTVFKKDGLMHIVDNKRFVVTQMESIVQIALYLHARHNITAIFEIENNPKKITLLYDEAAIKKMILLLEKKLNQETPRLVKIEQ